jgi:hypothetical protein
MAGPTNYYVTIAKVADEKDTLYIVASSMGGVAIHKH